MKFTLIFGFIFALIALTFAAPEAPVQQVGTEKCTYGPAHWCASQENAAKCGDGAVKHCQTHVWNKN